MTPLGIIIWTFITRVISQELVISEGKETSHRCHITEVILSDHKGDITPISMISHLVAVFNV